MSALDAQHRAPVAEGDPLAAWVTAAVLEARGDVAIVRASGDIPARVAVFRYRGAEPLPRFLENLKSDGDRWRTLRHPNLMPTLETGRLPSQITCYWAQEEVLGQTLAERLLVHPLIAPDHSLAIARQLGAALSVVHRAELVHGDVAPHNIVLVDAKDRPRLAWGGLALRLEAAGMDAGRTGARLAELAPELLSGKDSAAAADVYGLCAVLYRMLAGQPAWNVRRGGAPPGVTATEPLPSLPEWVGAEVVRLLSDGLQRDPARRPGLTDLLDRIEDQETAVRGQPVPLGTWSPAEPAPLDPSMTPPTVSRTVEPLSRQQGGELDPTLANTPPSVSRYHDLGGITGPPTSRNSFGGGLTVSPAPSADRSHGSRTAGTRSLVAPAPSPLLVPAAILAGAVVLGLFLVGGLWLTVGGRVAATPPPEPVTAPLPATIGVAPPPAVGPGILMLFSDPPGAEVWTGGRFVGLTPTEVVFDPAQGTDDRVYDLKLTGFEPQRVRQPFSTVDVRNSVVLRPTPRGVEPATAGPRPTGKAKSKAADDLGIKVER